MSIDEIEARITVLEDIEKVKSLMSSYTYLIDTCQWDDVAALFADNAKAEWNILGSYDGKEAIANFFKNVVSVTIIWAAHQLLNPLVTVEGNKAKGTWYLFGPATVPSPEGEQAIWIQGRYDNEFVKEGYKWKVSLLKFAFVLMTPYEDGWVKSKMMGG
jgi:hypothetical protein